MLRSSVRVQSVALLRCGSWKPGATRSTICARSPLVRLTVETCHGESTVVPVILTSSDNGESVDWVCIATKAHDATGTAVWLRSLVEPATRVAVLQNGVEHVARFAPYVPETQI